MEYLRCIKCGKKKKSVCDNSVYDGYVEFNQMCLDCSNNFIDLIDTFFEGTKIKKHIEKTTLDEYLLTSRREMLRNTSTQKSFNKI